MINHQEQHSNRPTFITKPATLSRSRKTAGAFLLALMMLMTLVLAGCSQSTNTEVPDVTGATLSAALDTLKGKGFTNIKAVDGDGKDANGEGWKVTEQKPKAGKAVAADHEIKLTVGKDPAQISTIATKGRVLSDVEDDLKEAGFKSSDYEVKSDTGKAVLMSSNWIVQSVTDGDKPIINVRKESDIKAEEEAKKAAEEEAAKKKAEEEQAKKAAEEAEAAKKAAEEQATQEQAAQAQQQAEQQAQQQQQQAQQQAPQDVYYPNCAAARAAGAAPLYQGQPGYSTKLDRDGDGVACE